MAEAILVTRGLAKEFRGFWAVDGVDLDIAEGSVHALVGPNGAGKTTLFNLLTGFIPRTSGSIRLAGVEIGGRRPEEVARVGLARSFQITNLFPQLSLRRHLELALAGPTGLGWRFWRSDKAVYRFTERADELLDEVGLLHQAEQHAGLSPTGVSARWNRRSRWPSTRRCCCWTSRPRGWASRTSAGQWRSCRSSAPGGPW
ncbi:ATP-binding cassette domain-containing protein [Microbispora sp. NPDC046933]|uniref:ATP-binding cassette domain-containing protein n=1 Tax=Microbispora sp. NPDC046933 TaxID=3155618 RepID=UPI0033E2F500